MKHKDLVTRRSFVSASAVAAASALPFPKLVAGAQELPPVNRADQWVEPGTEFQMDFWCLPRVQFWSFDNADPIRQVYGLAFSVQIITTGQDENTYSLHKGSLHQMTEGERIRLQATQLTTAGQQELVAGSCDVWLQQHGDRVMVEVSAAVPKKTVRAVKLILHALPAGRVGFTSWESVPNLAPVPVQSLALSYPSYQGGAPVWFLATEGESGFSFSSSDLTPRPRRFVASREATGGTRIELIAEQDAQQWSERFTAPMWEIARGATLDAAIAARVRLLEEQGGMRSWERRADVPPWVHDIGLVVCLHGMHWSGYIHNDYAKMRDSIEWVTSRIPGKNVLFFIAGWEGRYYRSYGNSVPNARMGGDRGFAALIETAHAKGAHVMAMYAGNAAMPETPHFDEYAPDSHFHADGNLNWTPMRGYAVDWATVRGSDTDEAVWLNPGAPGWRQHLTDQVRATMRDFAIDGAFFDTQPNTENDRVHAPIDGLRKIVKDLRSDHPEFMIATESWLDTTFSFLHAGQTPAAYKNWSSHFGRRFAHLAMGEPSRGSTGVHEAGYCEYNFEQVMNCFDWPTLALVDTTLRDAPEKADRVVQYAKTRLRRT
jgi:hypothetical protein